ncbi:MAG: molybdenum cofactor guanylyltransferase [Deltaproteobacteria bacterium]|nr:molybdenum cofactor guanylyltransferase [Deltaproteobacteria bacterium]
MTGAGLNITDAVCIILVGGESKRMQPLTPDKSKAVFGGKTLLQNVYDRVSYLFDETLVSARDERYVSGISGKIRTIKDAFPGRGPAVGICSAMAVNKASWAFVVGCDHPLAAAPLIRHLAALRHDYDCVIPEANGRLEPLFAFYSKRFSDMLTAEVQRSGSISITDFIKALGTRAYIVKEADIKKHDPALLSFLDVDTPEELKAAEEKYLRQKYEKEHKS